MTGEFAVALPLLLWGIFRLTLPRGPYEFDHGPAQAMGTFFALMPHWTRLFLYIATVSIIGAAVTHGQGLGMPALLLLLAFVDAVLFCGFMTLNYENYLAHKFPRDGSPGMSSYTIGKYALSLSLGFSAVILMLAGLGWAAWSLA